MAIPDRQQMVKAFEEYGRRCKFSVAKDEHGDYAEQVQVYFRVWKAAWQAFRILATIAEGHENPAPAGEVTQDMEREQEMNRRQVASDGSL